MSALYVCLICLPDMSVLFVCLICLPYPNERCGLQMGYLPLDVCAVTVTLSHHHTVTSSHIHTYIPNERCGLQMGYLPLDVCAVTVTLDLAPGPTCLQYRLKGSLSETLLGYLKLNMHASVYVCLHIWMHLPAVLAEGVSFRNSPRVPQAKVD